MIFKRDKMAQKKAYDGNGEIKTFPLLDGDGFDGVSMLSRIVLEPGVEIGYHEHHGEGELYYIINGKGLFNDNGEKKEVCSGDFCITESGQGHSLVNSGYENIEMLALIFKEYLR